jgi:hypothetical protein
MKKLLVIFLIFGFFGFSLSTQADLVLADGQATAQWYNPERNGEGFFVEIFVVGNDDWISIAMFTFDENGEQMWLTGAAELNSGQTFITIPVNRFDGPVWGPDYDMGDLNIIPFGEISVSFPTCDTGMFQVITDGELTNGNYSTIRLTDIKGIDCFDPDPPQQAVTPGRWKGPGVCFNVADDGLSIISVGSTCDQDRAFESNLQGLNNDGKDCGVEAYCPGFWIIKNGTFNCTSTQGTLASGTFSSNSSATGFAVEGEGGFNDVCTALWTATPD